MRISGSANRRRLIVSAAGLAVSAFLVAPAAQASAKPSPTANAAKAATAVAKKLGDSATAGTYLDRSTGRMVVAITRGADASVVRAAGATPRLVTRSGAQLKKVADAMGAAHVGGTAWGVDPVSDQVIVTTDSTVTGARLAKVRSV